MVANAADGKEFIQLRILGKKRPAKQQAATNGSEKTAIVVVEKNQILMVSQMESDDMNEGLVATKSHSDVAKHAAMIIVWHRADL